MGVFPRERLELDATGSFHDNLYLYCLSLTGTRNSRNLLGRTKQFYRCDDDHYYFLFDFSSGKLSKFPPLHLTEKNVITKVYHVGSSSLLAFSGRMVHVYSDNNLTTLDILSSFCKDFSFYLSSKGLILFCFSNCIIRFKIRNVPIFF